MGGEQERGRKRKELRDKENWEWKKRSRVIAVPTTFPVVWDRVS